MEFLDQSQTKLAGDGHPVKILLAADTRRKGGQQPRQTIVIGFVAATRLKLHQEAGSGTTHPINQKLL